MGQGTVSSEGAAFGGWGETGVIRFDWADSSRLDRFSHRLRNDHDDDDDDDDDDDIDNGDGMKQKQSKEVAAAANSSNLPPVCLGVT